MNVLRKWSRILHRDFGFFFIGASIIYGLSGIALNHLKDWNPNYVVKRGQVETNISLQPSPDVKNNVLQFLDDIGQKKNFKNYYFPEPGYMKIFLSGGSSIYMDIDTGQGVAEYLTRRPVFYQVNYLHYNPNAWWMWFSDIFAGALILLAITSVFMVRGKKGAWGRGGIYIALGIILPIVFLIVFS
ncbi:MAG: PepSY-associated TM helix domain-containing protein [Bacteroidales bacterium]|nr:PepSY-associated TM helix domain-containing protein [Bacteroidales bacterium]